MGVALATKVFSSRADERLLSFADSLSRKEYGISYGQYCGTVLLRSIKATGEMPKLAAEPKSNAKKQAAAFIKGFSSRKKNVNVGLLSDSEIKSLIASRYE